MLRGRSDIEIGQVREGLVPRGLPRMCDDSDGFMHAVDDRDGLDRPNLAGEGKKDKKRQQRRGPPLE